jgi:predicted enzyme related to lactoylglutathione lyase
MYSWDAGRVANRIHIQERHPMGRPVAHFEILGPNPARLRGFYGPVFGWSLREPEPNDPTEYAMAYTGAGEGAIDGGIGRAPDGAAAVRFYVEVDSLQDTLAAIKAAGGRVVMAPMEIDPGRSIATFADPDGNVVGLVSE